MHINYHLNGPSISASSNSHNDDLVGKYVTVTIGEGLTMFFNQASAIEQLAGELEKAKGFLEEEE